MRRLLAALLYACPDPLPPARIDAAWPASPEGVPVWRGGGDRARLDPFFIDLFGPPPDDGREPGDFQKRDR